MPAALFQRVVDEAADMGVYLITVLGGEPFIRTDLLEVIAANPETYFQCSRTARWSRRPTSNASPSSAMRPSC